MKPKIKQESEFVDDEGSEEVDEEEMEEELQQEQVRQTVNKGRPSNKSNPPVRRYKAVAQQQVEGIFDSQTNTWLSTNIWDMLALIWEKLRVIESKLGDMTE